MDGINKGKQKLPCEICKGKCCTFPAMSKREFKTIRKYYKIPDGTVFLKTEYFVGQITPVSERDLKTCTFLDKNGRCSVYQHRPLTCKSYGEVKQLPCQYLYPKEADRQTEILIENNKRKKNDRLHTTL